MKIAIVLPDLRGGGAERILIDLAREWLVRGFDVDFVLLRPEGELLQLVPHGASVIDLGVERFRDAVLPLRAYARQQEPSVLLAAMWPLTVVTVMATRSSGKSVRAVLSDHSILSRDYQHKGMLHRALLRLSMAFGYRWADALVAVSVGVAADASALSGIRPDRFRVIFNPAAKCVSSVGRLAIPTELAEVRGQLILSVGTLKAVKDHPLLIDAFSRLAPYLDVTLCILGEGPLRVELERLVIRRGLQGRVLLPGFRVETGPWYARADLFVLSSRHEGFGNVLVEALEHGVPVVSTDCPTGPREILCDGKYGRLVPVGDADALAEAMRAGLSETPRREALKARSRDFCADRIADEYLEVMFPGWRGAGRQ
ncbi:MAG: glycosyltransferase [Anderseniella sp.]|jgi:glycosyltransferase involved in cell wall biosynthesis|nr:glycosyltransferase [Anderseniella sp.]